MGKVVNLNRYRKLKAKAEAAKRADTNRRLHGRTKAERANDEHKKRLLDAKLDGARLERVADPEPQEANNASKANKAHDGGDESP
jgi:hypothetical protein